MASRITSSAFRRKTPSTGVPPPPTGAIPPPYTGVSPLYVARNIVLGGAAGYVAYWSYTRMILPRIDAVFRPPVDSTKPADASRIEVLTSPLANEASVQTSGATPASNTSAVVDSTRSTETSLHTQTTVPAKEEATLASTSLPPPVAPQSVSADDESPSEQRARPPAVRGDPWWLPYAPLQLVLGLMGLSPWPFDYGSGSRQTTPALETASAPSTDARRDDA